MSAANGGREPGDGSDPAGEAAVGGSGAVLAGGTGLTRTSAVVFAGTATSRVTGFLRLAVQTWAIGALSAYNTANTVPNLLFDLLAGGVLTATLVPVFVDTLRREDDEARDAVWTMTTVLLIAVTGLGLLAAPLIALVAPDATEASAYRLLLWMFIPQVLFYGLTTLASSLLNAHHRFAAAAFAPVVNNLVAMGVLVWVGTQIPQGYAEADTTVFLLDNPALLAVLGLGTTVGIVLQAAVLWPAMRRAGIRIRARFEPRNPAVRSVLTLSGWVFAYVATNQVAILAFVLIAALVDDAHGVGAYTVAWLFFQLPYGLFAASIITAAVPDFAHLAQRGEHRALTDRVLTATRLTVLFTLPAAAVYLALARPLVGVSFQRGKFGGVEADLSAAMLVAFSVGVVFFSIYLLVIRTFYAARNTRRPFGINLIETALQLGFGLALLAWLGIPGLALGFSIAYAIGTGLAFWNLRRSFGELAWREHVSPILKMVAAGALMTAVMLAVAAVLDGDSGLAALQCLAIAIPAGGAVYVGALFALRVPDTSALLRAFRRS